MTHILLSDAHLFPEWDEHPGRATLLRFLVNLADRKPMNLWLLGDLFDYWFEYRGVCPGGYGTVLHGFRRLSESGWTMHFIPGNHDWWVGRLFCRETGFQIHRETPFRASFDGLAAVLAHGDGLGPGDWGYRALKPILKARVSRRLFSLLHPTTATWFAMLFSDTSRKILRKQVRTIPAHLEAWAGKQLQTADLVVTGHTHVPRVASMPGGVHVSLGDWISSFTYLKVEEGIPSLERFEG
jgi:UDP-2,3-diacylglucosamine hydrolase